MKKKILHIITSLSGGGAQSVLFRLVSTSKKLGSNFDHEILNLSREGFYGKKFADIGVKVTNIGIPRGKFSFYYLYKIIHFLRKNDYDLVQTWMYHADFLGGILARIFTKKKVIWNIRSSNLSLKLNRWHTVLIAKICSLLSFFIPSIIIANSNKAISYHKKFGYSKKRFNLIFNGFDSLSLTRDNNKRQELRSKFDIDHKDFVIGNIARWDPQKDHKNLLEAISKINNKQNLKLFLLGENINQQNQNLMELINKYEIKKENIILHEQTNEIYDFINIFDVTVISSVGESFPNAIPESMLMEIPVISTKVGDIQSVLNNNSGWICEPSNSTELSIKIENAISEFELDTIKWNKRKNYCRKKIINFFHINEMVENYNNIWSEILNNEIHSNIKKFKNFNYRNDKPTICHIISSMSHGGAQQVLARIIRNDKNVNHEIISLMSLGRYGNELVSEGYNILSLNMNKVSLNIIKILRIYKILKLKKYDLVQTWMYHADLIGGIICFLLNKKVYWNIRNSDLNFKWSSYLTIIIQKFCSIISKKVPYKIISCSQRALNIHSKIGYDNSKFKVIDNGFDLKDLKSDQTSRIKFRNKYEIDEDEFIFGMVARWDPQKDFSNLMRSIDLFFEKNENVKVRFFLAGPNVQQNNKELTDLISLKVKKKIELLGNFIDIKSFMNGIDCHVLSSAGNEGFPNVIGEAMACNLPCISTDVGDVSKLIIDKNWIVPTASPEDFSQKMINIYNLSIKDKTAITQIGERNREHILKNFEISKVVNAYHSNWFNK